MARYEATGEAPLRAAAEAFWHELHGAHQFVTGGSTAGEVWMKPHPNHHPNTNPTPQP